MRTLTRRTMGKGLLGLLGLALVGCGDDPPRAGAQSSTDDPGGETPDLRVETVAAGLVAPWSLPFAPDRRIFVTERPGRLRVLTPDGQLRPEPVAEIGDVAAQGEGGLLGIALDPDFAANHRLYLYYTFRSGGGLQNRVVRFTENDNRLTGGTIILDGIPGASTHNGGRIAFGPDGMLYVTTGDGAQRPLAQELDSLAGKILRVNADGSVPTDNPFRGSPVYSYGHRNPQGLAWHPETGQLFATEHGASGNDEVNLIEGGRNYGWPTVEGWEHGSFRAPLAVYAPAIAPSGATWYTGSAIPQWRGSLLFATLRGSHLHRVSVDTDDRARVSAEERLFEGEYGRLRDAQQGPDGALYLLTSNRDGRGNPSRDDDRVLRVRAV